jgi:N-acetyl-beta-hexosaminidase
MLQHLTDSEAFPVESTALNATALAYRPADGCRTLSANGSHPPSGAGEHPQRCTYSQDELRALVAYATDRGVRVVPEFGTLTTATLCARALYDCYSV